MNGSFVLVKLVLWSCLVLSRNIICFQQQIKKNKKKKKLQKRSKGTKIICLFHVCPTMDNSSIGPHKKYSFFRERLFNSKNCDNMAVFALKMAAWPKDGQAAKRKTASNFLTTQRLNAAESP